MYIQGDGRQRKQQENHNSGKNINNNLTNTRLITSTNRRAALNRHVNTYDMNDN